MEKLDEIHDVTHLFRRYAQLYIIYSVTQDQTVRNFSIINFTIEFGKKTRIMSFYIYCEHMFLCSKIIPRTLVILDLEIKEI